MTGEDGRLPIPQLDPEGAAAGKYVLQVDTSGPTHTVDLTAALGLTIQDENGNIATDVSQMDFQGAGVTVTPGTGEVIVTVPGGGGGGTSVINPTRVLLADTTLGAAAASIDFSGISQSYDELEVVLEGGMTAAAQMLVALNNDTTNANYSRQAGRFATSTASSGAGADRWIGSMGTGASVFALQLRGYSRASLIKVATARSDYASDIEVQNVRWSTAAAVTQITLFASGTTFLAGTRARVYGIKDTRAAGISLGFRGARAVAASQNISSGVATPLVLATEEYDTDGIHDNVTNNTRFTIPAGMGGVWRFSGTVAFTSVASTGARGIFFFVNGVNTMENGGLRVPGIGSVQNSVSSTVDLLLNAGDYVELAGIQQTGSTLAVTGKLAAEYRGGPAGWVDWTPTFNNFTGTVNFARIRTDGKTCRVQVAITLDAAPTGRLEVVMPATALATLPTGNMGPVGTCIGNDVGTARRVGAAFFLAGNVIAFGSDGVTSFWGVSAPHVWAAGDTVAFNAEFELA